MGIRHFLVGALASVLLPLQAHAALIIGPGEVWEADISGLAFPPDPFFPPIGSFEILFGADQFDVGEELTFFAPSMLTETFVSGTSSGATPTSISKVGIPALTIHTIIRITAGASSSFEITSLRFGNGLLDNTLSIDLGLFELVSAPPPPPAEIPLPAAAPIFMVGLAGLALARRRRRRAR